MGQPQTNCHYTFCEMFSIRRVHELLVNSTKLYIVICETVLSDLSEICGYTLFVCCLTILFVELMHMLGMGIH